MTWRTANKSIPTKADMGILSLTRSAKSGMSRSMVPACCRNCSRGYKGWMKVIAVNAKNVMMSISLVLYIFPSFVFLMYQTAHQIPDIHSDGK